jgi:hypothetical protein
LDLLLAQAEHFTFGFGGIFNQLFFNVNGGLKIYQEICSAKWSE